MTGLVVACNRKVAPTDGSGTQTNNQKSKTESKTTNTTASSSTPTFDNKNNNSDVRIPVSMELGKSTFVGKCGKCHELKQAGNYTKDQWTNILKVMTVKAKLTPEETDAVSAYLMANAK